MPSRNTRGLFAVLKNREKVGLTRLESGVQKNLRLHKMTNQNSSSFPQRRGVQHDGARAARAGIAVLLTLSGKMKVFSVAPRARRHRP